MTMDTLSLNICTEPVDSPNTDRKNKKKLQRKRKPPGDDVDIQKDYGNEKRIKLSESAGGRSHSFRTHKRNDNFQNENKKVTGVISSLFGSNPEVPLMEHKEVEPIEEAVFTSDAFKDLTSIHPFMVSNLEQSFNITTLTTIQRLSFPELLDGKDALIRSQTGSGKTLAYAVPIIQQLQAIRPKLSRAEGVRALVVLPTRELALQTYECFLKLAKSFAWIVPGILCGGEKRKSEKARLRKGITILVGTPGRILDHAGHTQVFSLHNVGWLILDEADKLLDMGYEKDVSSLVEILNKQRQEHFASLTELPKRQTVLVSATLTPAVERLAGLALESPIRVDSSLPEDSSNFVIPQSLSQKYIITQAKLRLVTLAAFIIRRCEVEGGSKMLIFMATQNMVDFHTDLLTTVLPKTADFLKLHGSMNQPERTQVFKKFRAASAGVLFCTDVAARGLDLPKVDWIIQYNAPATPADYVHRVGRTARVGTVGSSLIFLVPSEMSFLEELNSKRIRVEEELLDYCLESLLLVNFESNEGKHRGWGAEDAAIELQLNFEEAVIQQKKLYESACNAYKSWVRFYATYPREVRKAFNFKSLHLGHFAKSFALRDAPTSIGGIRKPSGKFTKQNKKKDSQKKPEPFLKKRKIISEFDSGI